MTTKSNSQLAELCRRIALQRNWSACFLALFGFAAGLATAAQADLAAVVASLAAALYLWMVISLSRTVQRLEVQSGQLKVLPSRTTLERQVTLVERTLRTIDRWSYLSFPLLALSGFTFSLNYYHGFTLAKFLADPVVLAVALALLVVLVPAGLYVGDYLTERKYRKPLSEMRGSLDALRQLEEADA